MTERIGDMNGKWSVLAKAALTVGWFLLVSLTGLQVWVVKNIYQIAAEQKAFMAAGPRYTPRDARADQLELKADIMQDVASIYPPKYLLDKVADNTRRLEYVENQLRNGRSQRE